MKMGSYRYFKCLPNDQYSSDKPGCSTFFYSEFEQFASRRSHERAVHCRGIALWIRQSSILDMTELLFFEGTYGHSFTSSIDFISLSELGWKTPRLHELTLIYSLELETDNGKVGGTEGIYNFERGDVIWFGVCAEPLSARANLLSHTYLGVVWNAPYPATSDERLETFSGPLIVMSVVVNEIICSGSGAGSVRETSRMRLEKSIRDYGNSGIIKVMGVKGSMRMQLLSAVSTLRKSYARTHRTTKLPTRQVISLSSRYTMQL